MIIINVSICCNDQTPSWLPSSPKGEIVGNMMQSVVIDGNLLDEVVLDGNDVNLMYLQINSEVAEERNLESARIMLNKVCHNAYVDFLK